MAIKKTIEIDLNISEAQKSLDKFGGTLEDVKGEGVQPLNFAIGELEDRLYEMAAAGDTSSKQFREMSAEVGKMKKVIIDVDMTVDGMSQTLSQNVGGALGGVASGFELAQGAMGAFGASGEAVQESLLKVQSAMAMSQGLQGIKESVSSFKAMRKAVMGATLVQSVYTAVVGTTSGAMKILRLAMIATGIGALVVGVVALVMNFKKVTGFIQNASDKMGVFGKAIKYSLMVALWPFVLAVKAIMWALEELGIIEGEEAKATRKHHEAKIKQVNERLKKEKEAREQLKKAHEEEQKNLDKLIALASAQGKSTVELTKQKINGSIEYQKQQLKEIENNIRILEHMAKAMPVMEDTFNDMLKVQKQFLQDSNDAISQSEHDLEILDIEVNKDKTERYKQHLSDRLASKREIEDKTTELEKDDEKRKLERLRLDYERELEEMTGNEKEKAAKKLLIDQKYQEEAIAIKLSFIEPALQIRDQEVLINEDKNRQIIESDKRTAAEKKAIAREETKEKAKAVGDQYTQATQGLQMIADFALAIAGKNEKARKVAFNIQKAASIAQATIDTYKNATAAYGSFASIPILGVPLGIAAAGAAIAAGIANVRSIASTQFEGGGGGTPATPSLPSGGVGGGGNVANFNVVGNTGVNQLAESLGGQEQVVKAFVVSGDVTTAQGLDRNKIDTATL